MTYIELMHKAFIIFSPGEKGLIQGYPVEVLCTTSRLADKVGWEKDVDRETLQRRLSSDCLDSQCVSVLLSLL